MKSKNNEKSLYKVQSCRNCGINGHIYKNCPHPIISFGIICYKLENKELKYLMIQRKDSIAFMEFIRGKYEINNIDYIKQLLNNMVLSERNMIINSKFDDIWNYVWQQGDINKNNKEFINSKIKFSILNDNNFLKNYITSIKGVFAEREYGFAKGRRKMRESDIDCAVREFYEETRIKKEDIQILDHIMPFEEIFFGTNGVMYKHVYYVAKLINDDLDVKVDENCLEQVREIRAIKWYNSNEVIAHIKSYYVERIELFKFACKKIMDFENLNSPEK
jgi:8-oxo-dGTP pyrophosphatase MutT (NUDIX family)